MENPNQITTDKKIYSKPQVTEVRLVAGEAVLGDCKARAGDQINDCPLNSVCTGPSTAS